MQNNSTGSSTVCYVVYNLCSGKTLQEFALPTHSAAFLAQSPHKVHISVTGDSEGVCVVLDGNSAVYPINRDGQHSNSATLGTGQTMPVLREPLWPDLPSITALATSQHFLHAASTTQKNTVALLVFCVAKPALITPVLAVDAAAVTSALTAINDNNVEEILAEKCDGNRNVLHACVSTCYPTESQEQEGESTNDPPPPPPPSSKSSTPTSVQSDPFLSLCNWPSSASGASGALDEASDEILGIAAAAAAAVAAVNPSGSKPGSNPPPGPGQPDRKTSSLSILKLICDSVKFTGHQLRQLLAAKDSNGQTPFMSAVSGRAYKAALVLLDVIQRVAKLESLDDNSYKRAMESMIFPSG